jgi:hypothetical protein
MKIVFQAFHWKCQSSTVNIKNFLDEWSKNNGKPQRNKIFYFIEDKDYWIGIILTIKDMRKFVTLVESKQEIKLDVHELDDNEKIADFNFFVIDKYTGYGLYQYYYQSCSLNNFNYLAKSYYNEIKKNAYNQAKERYENEGKSKNEIKKLMQVYKSVFTTSIIERKGKFLDRVQLMKDANSINIEFEQIDYSNSPFQAIQPILKSMRYKLIFLKDSSPVSKISNVVTLLTNNIPKRATIDGLDENGHDIVYRLFNDFDRFKEYDYEDMVPSLRLDQSNASMSIKNNAIIIELKSVFKSISPSLKL